MDVKRNAQTSPKVIVIGAGLAGLTAAAHLADRGLSPLVLEANQVWAGGRLSGGEPEVFAYAGQEWSFPAEHGIHGLWGGYANMRATLRRFVTDPDLAPRPSTGEVWINRWGESVRHIEAGTAVRSRWIPAPLHYFNLLFRPRFWRTITPLDFLSAPGLFFSILWTVGYDPIKEKSALDGLTMDDYFRLWTPNLRATIEGVARNMLAAPDDAITLTGLIAALRFYTILRRDAWHPHFFPANTQTSVIGPLAEAITSRGGEIRHGMTVKRLERAGERWRVIYETARSDTPHTVEAQHVVLATHPAAAQTILCSSDDTRETAEKIRFPGSLRNAVVRLWFNKDAKNQAPSGMFTGDFVPDNYFWLHRIHREFSEWAAGGGSAIELHFYGDRDLLNQPDKHFLAMGLNEVVRAFPELKGAFVHGSVRRNSATHTAFQVPTADSLHVETPWPNLHACGDWIGYDTPSLWMERACTTGVAAANAVLSDLGAESYTVESPPPPEPLVRVLGGTVRGVRWAFSPLVGALRRRRRVGES